MSIPQKPNILDHIVHLSPPKDLIKTVNDFKKAGFNVFEGGVHADKLTSNYLIVLSDGTYIELIQFVDKPEAYINENYNKRVNHFWANKLPGWIDYACLGVKKNEVGVEEFYEESKDGGRTLSDGKTKIEWSVSFPLPRYPRGSIPFYCGDKTPRELRVPMDKCTHSNNVNGLKSMTLLCAPSALNSKTLLYTSVLKQEPVDESDSFAIYHLESPSGKTIKLTIRIPQKDSLEEDLVYKSYGECVYEVEFSGSKTNDIIKITTGGRVVLSK